jgi:dTDP-4-amino-4,6-dideoxygalactose transaminase
MLEIADTLRSGWITTGPKARLFEKELGAHLGATQTLALSSCTAALHLGLKALNVGPGDGVITTPLTFVSTVHAIVYTGARPFFCDIDPFDGNLSPEKTRFFLENHCRRGPHGSYLHPETNTTLKAILPVHYGGFPVELEKFQEIAKEFKLHILEDAAHALGAAIGPHKIGSDKLQKNLGPDLYHLAAFSFYATKNLTTSEGGLLTGPSPILSRARILSAYGIGDSRQIWHDRYAPDGSVVSSWDYDVETLGYKNNFTDIQAALGLSQLRRFPDFQEKRQLFSQIYTRALEDLDSVTLPTARPGTTPAWHLFPIRLKIPPVNITREKFTQILREHNLGTSVMFRPVHTFSYYQDLLKYPYLMFPNSLDFFHHTLSLPMSPKIPVSTIEEAAQLVRQLLKQFSSPAFF